MVKAFKSTKVYKLSTGSSIPALGLGTWRATDEEVYNSVLTALKAGYRHIDTAAGYGNEEPIGKAIKDSGISRDQIFVTTKLWSTKHYDPESALKESLSKLGLEYVDLYLMHWPLAMNPNGNHPAIPTRPDGLRDIVYDWSFTKTWKLMEPLVEQGLTKSLGISNCTVSKMKELFDSGLKVKPVCNQVELHPYLPQHKLLEFAKEHDVVLEAYSPLGSADAPLLKDESIKAIAEKYGVSSATVIISWAIWRGTVVLPKSVKPERIESNLEIIELEDKDGEALNRIAENRGGPQRFVSPPWDPVVIFDSSE
ncbi:aldo/keto reductase [Yamadazyma tenuis]|uniref:2-dehydropantolactone reductase n=1 Tax=Candida tenuis (strain ATCC 10573 / BCRC 21748 / CBS 615 / JCM 9827 / NBRC 10315 / NRRL Y-1498 / VKM Y-70) TaxID=590646 RepID=G3B406_CANTC|nr:Aldo/keto reductase [Yamadazyma tenuis ATCC 10573]EGV63905.1 Aldo/keto reductase [Yamadazyma tenuis ATCC 10573]WEJ96474.1 aldo/keto reductase [Yamadazyma tenuis]